MIVKQILALKAGPEEIVTIRPETTVAESIRLLSERGEVADDYLEFRDTVETAASAMAAMRANDVEVTHAELRNVGTHSWASWRDDVKLSFDKVFKKALGLEQ